MTAQSGRDFFRYGNMLLRKLQLEEYGKLGWFDCGDEEINDFFHNDAFSHRKELIAESYSFEVENRPLALISIQNDSIHFADNDKKERLSFGYDINLPFCKRYNSLPAIKLGRLGVHKKFSGNGFGSNLLECCKLMFVNENRTGCRLILVDAYIKAKYFYEKNKFRIFPNQLVEDTKEDDTLIMYCDLKPYSNI